MNSKFHAAALAIHEPKHVTYGPQRNKGKLKRW